MSYMILGLAILIAVVLFGRWYAQADIQSIKKALIWIAVGFGVLIVLLMLLTRQFVWLVAFAPAIIAWIMRFKAAAGRAKAFARMAQGASGGRTGGSSGQKSTVRTRYLAAELDHDTGALDAEVIDGAHKGSRLADMSLEALLSLYGDCGDDPQSAQILEAFLDREHPHWRDGTTNGEGASSHPQTGPMSRAEALEILGLEEGADAKTIKEAHRRLMANVHPDKGGSTYLASKINEAKDVLLGNRSFTQMTRVAVLQGGAGCGNTASLTVFLYLFGGFMIKPVRKAVFPVAGLGTRFLPATKSIPKEMLPVVDKPLIQYAVEEAFEAGIEEIVFVTGRGKSAMEDHFDHAYELEDTLEQKGKADALAAVRDLMAEPGRISYVRQQRPLGLGHAVWCGRAFVGDEPFAVVLPDDLILSEPGVLKQMVDVYNETGGNVVAVEDVPRELTNRYGILDVIEDDGRIASVKGLVEKPDPSVAPSTLSIIGRYILQPEVFTALNSHERGAGGEIQLTDAMAKTIGTVPFFGYRFGGKRFDCGSKAGFIEANVAFALATDELADDVRQILKTYL